MTRVSPGSMRSPGGSLILGGAEFPSAPAVMPRVSPLRPPQSPQMKPQQGAAAGCDLRLAMANQRLLSEEAGASLTGAFSVEGLGPALLPPLPPAAATPKAAAAPAPAPPPALTQAAAAPQPARVSAVLHEVLRRAEPRQPPVELVKHRGARRAVVLP